MSKIVLGRKDFRDKVYACWLGKNIGGTLGGPYEGQKHVHDLTYYDPVPHEPAPNDDLDFQLVWLTMLEDRGLPPRFSDFTEYWQRCLCAYPWNEYGFCMRNLERGLMPPVSGWFENYYVDEMGSAIRSEIWACVCPADPQRAAALAWMDSCMDHAGGEGMYSEMFWAAAESAAFVLDDPAELIRIGLGMIPPACGISRVVREALWCHENGLRWSEARERIASTFGHAQPCNAVPNHGFIVLGWLYGEDFGERLCKAVNCGYDTDCTGATLGALLGILGGTASIPERWSEPVGTSIKLHPFTAECRAPRTLAELTDRTVVLAEESVQYSDRTAFGARTSLPHGARSLLHRNDEACGCLQEDVRSAVAADDELDIIFYYDGDPVLYPHVSRAFDVECRRLGFPVEVELELELPHGWELLDEDLAGVEARFVVEADQVADHNTVGVTVYFEGRTYRADFTVLGPDAARGYPAATNVERCPTCHGRQGTCLCTRRQEPEG